MKHQETLRNCSASHLQRAVCWGVSLEGIYLPSRSADNDRGVHLWRGIPSRPSVSHPPENHGGTKPVRKARKASESTLADKRMAPGNSPHLLGTQPTARWGPAGQGTRGEGRGTRATPGKCRSASSPGKVSTGKSLHPADLENRPHVGEGPELSLRLPSRGSLRAATV